MKLKFTFGHPVIKLNDHVLLLNVQCVVIACKTLFTTLELAKRHIMLSGHSQVQVQTPEDDNQGFEPVSDCEPESEVAAVIPDIRAFLGSQYKRRSFIIYDNDVTH